MKKKLIDENVHENMDTSVTDDLPEGQENNESELISTLKLLLDETNIKGKTILNNRQVTALTVMNILGQIYDIPFIRNFVLDWCKYRISGDSGKGRNDLIEIAKALRIDEFNKNNVLADALKR